MPTIPFYVFYSIFGFQRVGDMIWSAGDMLCRGFLLGGTSGRTTLNGEGPQHQDGHSQVVANTVPNMRSYDPAFACELAVIVRDGIERMYGRQEDVFYYITIHNQNYAMPAMPDGAGRGHRARHVLLPALGAAPRSKGRKAHLFGSGAIMSEVLEAAQLLEAAGVAADVWSVTSYNELCREALRVERANRLAGSQARQPYVQACWPPRNGVFVAASDYMKALPLSIARWVPGPYTVLGTDGYGLSESREDLRRHFEVSAAHIAYAAAATLAGRRVVTKRELKELPSLGNRRGQAGRVAAGTDRLRPALSGKDPAGRAAAAHTEGSEGRREQPRGPRQRHHRHGVRPAEPGLVERLGPGILVSESAHQGGEVHLALDGAPARQHRVVGNRVGVHPADGEREPRRHRQGGVGLQQDVEGAEVAGAPAEAR